VVFSVALVLMTSLAAPRSHAGELVRRGGEIGVRTAKGIQHPGLASLPNGGFVIAWSEPISNWQSSSTASFRTSAPTPNAAFVLRSHKDVVAAWFDAAGQLVRGPLVVNETPTGETTLNWYVQVAAAADGTVLVTWRNWETRTILVRLYDSQGNAKGGELRLNSEPIQYYLGDVAAAATTSGGFIVVWNDLDETLPYDRHLLAARPVGTDGSLGDPFLVSRTDSPVDQILPSILALGSRTLLAVWFDDKGERTIRARLLGEEGQQPAFDIAGALEERRPRACALSTGELLFAWEGYQSSFNPDDRFSDHGAWFRAYGANGEPLTDPLPILAADNDVQHVSGFVCPSDDTPMVVIDYNDVLIGRAIGAGAFNTEFQIVRTNNPAAGSFVGGADVVGLSGSAFVITWAQCLDLSNDVEPDCELRAQVFARDGQHPCRADCNDDGHVSINELILATRIALSGKAEMRACLAADSNLDYRVDIAELVAGVATSLGGCQ
jgi:hypothetical protein